MTFLTTFAALCCLLPPAVLGKVSRDPTHKSISFFGSLLEVTLHCQCHRTTLSLVPLCAVLSRKFCSLFLNSVKFVAGLKLSCITKFSYIIGRPLRTRALKRVSETASPASCSLEQLLTSDEETIQILSILELQSSKLCH